MQGVGPSTFSMIPSFQDLKVIFELIYANEREIVYEVKPLVLLIDRCECAPSLL